MSDLDEFEQKVRAIFDRRGERDGELFQILESPDDVVSIVLRGHLVIEELLFTAIAAYCMDVEQLRRAKLRFPQMIAVLRAIQKLDALPEKIWHAIDDLNALRNSLAHSLEPKELTAKINRFLSRLELPEELTSQATGERGQLRQGLHYLIGSMSVTAAFHAGLQEVIKHELARAAASAQSN